MSENSELMINPATRIPLTATGYVDPMPEDYAALKSYTGFTGLDFSNALGVSSSNFRSYFRAKNINSDKGIPYYHWRFLVEACGLEKPVTVKEPNNSGLNESVFDNKNWKSSWIGKQAFAADELVLTVIKGKVDMNRDSSNYQIDGLAGATLTTKGVDNLVQYWLGDQGFKPFIENLKSGEA